jgi:formylglycine-generating enzyme required for sulfatase activity
MEIKLVKLFIDRSDSKAATAPSVAGSDGDPAPATLSASPSDSPKPAVNTDSVAATGDAKPTSSMSGVSPVTIMTIVVVIVIIISLVVFGGNKLGISLANNPTYTSTPTTVEPTPETPTPPTPTKQPTATETPSPTPRDPAIVLAETGVESNAEWKPYIRVFDGVEMALVPAGCFIMGSEDGDSDETPMHEVCFDKPFWIDVYEVTNDQYGEAHAEDCMNWSKGGNQPRIYIDWYASAAHCESRGARLPTEAEWEYAARGPDGLIYPWGNDFECRHGNFDDEIVYYTNRAIEGGVDCDAFIETAPVGSFSSGVSWVGAHDMSGNVWEWVQDWYTLKYYTGTPESTPHEPSSIGYRVNRGGWWGSAMPHSLRGAERNGADPGYAGESLGFRCAHDYEPQGQDD